MSTVISSSLNPLITLNELNDSYESFLSQSSLKVEDHKNINFKTYQILFLYLYEKYLYTFEIVDQEFVEILKVMAVKPKEGDPEYVVELKELISHLYKFSYDLNSKWFVSFMDDAKDYFDRYSRMLH